MNDFLNEREIKLSRLISPHSADACTGRAVTCHRGAVGPQKGFGAS